MVKNKQRIQIDDLVARARTDTEALSRLYEFYYGRIFRFCVYRLFVREVAEDVTSEIFLQVARKITSFHGNTEKEFRNWIYTIATNQANAYLRKSTRRKKLLVAVVQARTLEKIECNHSTRTIDWPILYQAIMQLKPKQQAIITLRYFENMTHEQIAAILGIKAITARVMLTRTLKKLRNILQADHDGDK